ncbi:uncharacterized protein CANTADRAFT_196118 [Suhomyces tanzawaensis NRRL Y-17324]|uniref:Uncharacterized protein n=1 Tax=Suhomyces tanzawaensis NRRL Y-17324 TaxID=984487 RepID=A0A1E4SNY6_9ASCO|nr:uncharacterized protein CANTADRAFT_196118 [Suhomyces tanzawaensis NRRL Y-17324]ODV81206.1 hypothetical protein CANTADRAFT_196118 [Suhomyces tanzawaensis NRRL Y-17324]
MVMAPSEASSVGSGHAIGLPQVLAGLNYHCCSSEWYIGWGLSCARTSYITIVPYSKLHTAQCLTMSGILCVPRLSDNTAARGDIKWPDIRGRVSGATQFTNDGPYSPVNGRIASEKHTIEVSQGTVVWMLRDLGLD